MNVRFFTFEQYHNKKQIGSTKIRVHNLLKYWPDAALYKYGENPDVLVFQKIYCSPDYKFPANFKGIKILDICDPDWLDLAWVKETAMAMDAVVCPTEPLAAFMRQLTDAPVVVIPDRHIVEELPAPKRHKGPITKLVWFGYKHNAETLREAIVSIARRPQYHLTIIANENPHAYHWAQSMTFADRYHYVPFNEETLIDELRKHDVVVFPQGTRPVDRFKSNNKTTLSWLAGLPVAKTIEDLERLDAAADRQDEADQNYREAVENYDVRKSVEEMKLLIGLLREKQPAAVIEEVFSPHIKPEQKA